jgi:hypothetical protein
VIHGLLLLLSVMGEEFDSDFVSSSLIEFHHRRLVFVLDRITTQNGAVSCLNVLPSMSLLAE